MITPLRIAALSLSLMLAVGCASSTDSKPTWTQAPEADIAGYTTFGWEEDEAPATILDNQIRNAIRSDLVTKGYVESSDAPDFLIDHEAVEHDAVERGNPVRIGVGVGSWGGHVGGSVGTSVDVGDKDKVVQQLRLTIRAVDPDERREVWVGTTAPMNERPDASAVANAIGALLKEFPAKRS
jgi:hypothetical protein